MRVCGLHIMANEAIVVVVEPSQDGISVITSKKLALANHENADDLHALLKTVGSFLQEYLVEVVAIKKRAGSGGMAASGVTFKIEALFQLSHKNLVYISPQAITKFSGTNLGGLPAGLRAYQKDAFFAAGCYLKKCDLI